MVCQISIWERCSAVCLAIWIRRILLHSNCSSSFSYRGLSNFFLPHIVAKSGSLTNERRFLPGDGEPLYIELGGLKSSLLVLFWRVWLKLTRFWVTIPFMLPFESCLDLATLIIAIMWLGSRTLESSIIPRVEWPLLWPSSRQLHSDFWFLYFFNSSAFLT